MTDHAALTVALDAFAEQFQAQVQSAGPPSHEHAVHFCIALGLQSAWSLPPGSIVFERPVGDGSLTDLWVHEPHDLAIEVKYLRPIPSGRNPPYPQLYGQVLADFNKVARERARHRVAVVVADRDHFRYIERSGRGLLPLRVGDSRQIDAASLSCLSDTAQRSAGNHGAWADLSATLVWSKLIGRWSLLAWEVAPRQSAPTS